MSGRPDSNRLPTAWEAVALRRPEAGRRFTEASQK